MITLRLHGHLRAMFGHIFRFEARTVKEAMRAMDVNFPAFRSEVSKDQRSYHVVVNNSEDYANANKLYFPLGEGSIVDVIPAIEGGGNIFAAIALIIIGVLLIVFTAGIGAVAAGAALSLGASTATAVAVGGYAAYAAVAIGYGLVAMGIAALMAPDPPKVKNEKDEKSTAFSDAENVVGQGSPVYIGYGRLIIGSNVISMTNESSLGAFLNATSVINGDTGEITDIYWHGDDKLFTSIRNVLNGSGESNNNINVVVSGADLATQGNITYTSGGGSGQFSGVHVNIP